MAELVDTMAPCEDDRGRGYDDGAAAGASTMVGNGEGERQGGMACPGVSVRDVEASMRPGARVASRWCRGELGHAGVTSLPAWRGQSRWLARVSTVLGRQVGRGVGLAR